MARINIIFRNVSSAQAFWFMCIISFSREIRCSLAFFQFTVSGHMMSPEHQHRLGIERITERPC